jgi:hypothetical protein
MTYALIYLSVGEAIRLLADWIRDWFGELYSATARTSPGPPSAAPARYVRRDSLLARVLGLRAVHAGRLKNAGPSPRLNDQSNCLDRRYPGPFIGELEAIEVVVERLQIKIVSNPMR